MFGLWCNTGELGMLRRKLSTSKLPKTNKKAIFKIKFYSQIGCSRYQNKHMLAHHDSTGHSICLSLTDHSFYCYACESYIDSPKLDQINQQFIEASQ